MKDQVEAEESLNIPGWIMVDVISTKENVSSAYELTIEALCTF